VFISVHLLIALAGGYIFLSSVANALDMNDRSFYKFFVKFMRSLTMNLAPYAEKELHVAHIEIPTTVPATTSVDVQTSTQVNPT